MSAQRQEKEMPFLDHLEELRWRLMWMIGTLVAGVLISFALMIQFDVVGVLMRPIAPFLQGGRLVFTSPTDPFRIVMMSSVALGGIFALPVIGWHVWAFLSPALYRHEKKVVIPVLLGATLLFMLGVALAFFVILPFTLRFLLGFQTESMAPMITASGYFGFAISVSLAFGAVFELPIVIVALTSLGIVTPQMLTRFRRYAVVLCLIASAFITPGGDPMTLLVMAGPLYLLYEVSIALSSLIHRRRVRRESRALAGEGAGA
ncbi:MAG TPA: twin-arginine translocase subunit TatC [Gemmatimonadaceae bacterium]|nr:twin-arginine translocase subunit TatC [Gemmatimonadaceae bacterium]